MATITVGTSDTTVLEGIVYQPGGLLPADVATIAANIRDDQNATHPVLPNYFSTEGKLFIPNRGILKLLPGDVVAVDTVTGWPILIGAYGATSGSWVIS